MHKLWIVFAAAGVLFGIILTSISYHFKSKKKKAIQKCWGIAENIFSGVKAGDPSALAKFREFNGIVKENGISNNDLSMAGVEVVSDAAIRSTEKFIFHLKKISIEGSPIATESISCMEKKLNKFKEDFK